MNSSLLSGGQHYDNLVNWKKRLETEIPFLNSFMTQIKPPIRKVLEAGCGTGRHSEALYKQSGYHITGVDIDESMIKAAQKRMPKLEFFIQDFLAEDLGNLAGRHFDAIFSLGNSVGLMAASYGYESIIKRFSKLIRSHAGLLIFQILNTEKERNEWSPPRTLIIPEGELLFLRGFKTTDHFIQPEILTLFKAKDQQEWKFHTSGITNIPRVSSDIMITFLQKYGFSNVKVFGNYLKDKFEPTSSIDMIFVAQN